MSKQRLLLGTHTSDEQQNYVLIVEVSLPLQDSELNCFYIDEDGKDVGGFGRAPGKIQVVQQINHDGEVNRARYGISDAASSGVAMLVVNFLPVKLLCCNRYMPQNSFLLATKTVHAEVYIFDYSKHPSKPQPDSKCQPDLRLLGHEVRESQISCRFSSKIPPRVVDPLKHGGFQAEGYGLAWSPFCEGQVISGSDDRKICLWNIKGNTHAGNVSHLEMGIATRVNELPISLLCEHLYTLQDLQ